MTDKDDSSEPSNLGENPFAALFPSMSQAVQYASQVKTSAEVQETLKSTPSEGHDDVSSSTMMHDESEMTLDVKRIVNNLLQRVFLITLQECKSFKIIICDAFDTPDKVSIKQGIPRISVIFLGQEEDALDREYGGIPESFVYLPGTALESERSSLLLDWDDMDQVNVN